MIAYIFQDYFSKNDSTKKKLRCILKAFIWPSIPSEKICVWMRMSMYHSQRGHKFRKQFYQSIVYKRFNCSISCDAQIGKGFFLPHPMGVVIGKGVIIGSNVTVYQGVTIGQNRKNNEEYPHIEDDVIIYCNSTVIGSIVLGKKSIVAANSLVRNSVECGRVVAGVPAVITR